MIRLQPTHLRTIGRVAAIAGVILGAVLVRVVVSSRSELREAEAAEQRNDTDVAVVHYRRAARWYAPGNPYCSDALEALARLGTRAEEQGEVQRALSAWRGVRSAILATRSFYTPHGAELTAANRRIAELMSGLPPPPMDAGKSRDQIRNEHYALLIGVKRPSVGWTLLLLAGFFSWVSGAFAFASRGFDAEDRLVKHEAKRWGLLILLGFTAFVVGMLFA